MSRDPYPDLPRPSLYARLHREVPSPLIDTQKEPVEAMAAPETENAAAPAQPRKRGRPKSTDPKPWEAAGVSRMTWYRRQKKERG